MSEERYKAMLAGALEKDDKELARAIVARKDEIIGSDPTPRAKEKTSYASTVPAGAFPGGPVGKAVAEKMEMAFRGEQDYELPTLADMPEFNEATSAGQNFINVARSPQTVGMNFAKQENERLGRNAYTMDKDSKGNWVVYRAGKPWAYADKPGADLRNTRDFAAEAVPYAATGIGLGRLLMNAPSVIRAMGIGGGEAAVQEVIGRLTGESPDIIDRAGAFTLGAASEMVGPTIKALMHNTPLTNKNVMNAEARLKELGVQNANPETIKLFALNDAKALPEGLDEERLLAMGQARVPMSQGVAMKGGRGEDGLPQQRQLARERGLSDVPEMARANEDTAAGIGDYIADQAGIATRRSEPEMAQEMSQMIKNAAEGQRDEAGVLYDSREVAADFGGDETWGFPSLELKLNEIVDKEGVFRATGKPMAGSKQAAKLYGETLEDINRIKSQGNYTIKDLDDIYRNFNARITRSGLKGEDAKVAGMMKNEYRKWLDTVAKDRLDPESGAVLQDLLDASDLWGDYMGKYGNKGDAVQNAIKDMAQGRADPELVGRAIFGGEEIAITGKQAANLMNAVPAKEREAMRGIMREGVARRVFGSVKTNNPKTNANDVLKELDSLFKGNRKLLGDMMYPPGSKARDEMQSIYEITQTLSEIEDTANIGPKAMENLSALYARVNTPIGLRLVFKIWNAPVEVRRQMLGKRYADASNQVASQRTRQVGRALGTAPIAANELEPTEPEQQ